MAGNGLGNRRRRGAGEWSLLLSRFATSGLSVAAFCRQEEICAASFYRWRGLLGGGAKVGEGDTGKCDPAFVDLGALGSSRPTGERLEIRLDLGGGLVLSLVRG